MNSSETARKLQVPAAEPQYEETTTTPVKTAKDVRKMAKDVLNTVVKNTTDYLDITKPTILDGDQYDPVNYYNLKGGKVTACLSRAKESMNSNVIMVDPNNDSFAVVQGLGGPGENRLAAREYAKAFKEYKNPFRAQVEAEKEIKKQNIHAGASYIYGKMMKEGGKKYFQIRSLGDDAVCFVFDKSGNDKTRPDAEDRIQVEKGDVVIVASKEMGLNSSDDWYGFMAKPGSYSLNSQKDIVKKARKAAADKHQSFVLMEIK